MSYLVMETHPAYAVVLDEEGRFLKAANLHYQVGDTVQEIVELRIPAGKRAASWKPLAGLIGLAACFCLVFFGYYQPNYTAYGTLRIQINPDVEMTVSRTDRVLELKGLNSDGEELIEGYSYQGKNREAAAGELVERAIDMGYLSDGDTVSITVRSDDAEWQAREEAQVRAQLEERYGESIVIRLGGDSPPENSPEQDTEEVVIPVAPPMPPAAAEENTDLGFGEEGGAGYGSSDYGSYGDDGSDYGDPTGSDYFDDSDDQDEEDEDDWDEEDE